MGMTFLFAVVTIIAIFNVKDQATVIEKVTVVEFTKQLTVVEFTEQLWRDQTSKCDSSQTDELLRFRKFVEESSIDPGSELIPDPLRMSWMISIWKANRYAPGALLDDKFVEFERAYKTPYTHEQLESIRMRAGKGEDPRVVLKKWINEKY